MGLIDSKATHPLRPARQGEIMDEYKEVTVTLASGEKTRLRMTSGGVMVTSDEAIEPIVPMGILVSQLGCKVTWVGEQLQVEQPRRGRLEVDVHLTGCPQISRNLALELIDELESAKKEKKVKAMTGEMKSDLTSWMVQLVDAHPVLRELPEWLRCRLAVEPGSWNFLAGNARMRKRWQDRGVLVHLYAGPDEGFTLRRALHQVGGTEAADDLLEIDIL